MARFLTSLRIEEINHKGRGRWQLLSPLAYKSDLHPETIVVPVNFVTDLASVPRLPAVFWLVGCMAHRAGVIHDWLYTSHEVSRELADAILEEAAKLDGAGGIKSWVLWAGVRVGGSRSWEAAGPDQPDNVREFLGRFK